MEGWQDRLRDFYQEQTAAERDAIEARGRHRTEAREFITDKVEPAFHEGAAAFGQHGRYAEVVTATDAPDFPSGSLVIYRRMRNRRDPSVGDSLEFAYTIRTVVEARSATALKELPELNERGQAKQELRREQVPVDPRGDGLGVVGKHWIVEDVLKEYMAYMRAQRE